MSYTNYDGFFRSLNDQEEEDFRRWARENWSKEVDINDHFYHPIIVEEWNKITEENKEVV